MAKLTRDYSKMFATREDADKEREALYAYRRETVFRASVEVIVHGGDLAKCIPRNAKHKRGIK